MNAFPSSAPRIASTMLLRSQVPKPARLPPALARTTSTAASHHRRRRRTKHKHIAFPFPPLRRLVSSSLRRLLPRPRLLSSGGWSGRRGRRKAPAEEVALLVLSLAVGDKLASLADSWNASGLGQALGVWAAVWRRGRRRGNGLRRLAALLLGVAFCTLVCYLRGVAFLESLGKTVGGRRLARILVH